MTTNQEDTEREDETVEKTLPPQKTWVKEEPSPPPDWESDYKYWISIEG